MSTKCPESHFESTFDYKFCEECGIQLRSIKDIEVTETSETSEEELITGSTFAGRYQIIEELGKGGMGKAYKAKDTRLKRTAVPVFLPSEPTKDETFKDRVIQEDQKSSLLDKIEYETDWSEMKSNPRTVKLS